MQLVKNQKITQMAYKPIYRINHTKLCKSRKRINQADITLQIAIIRKELHNTSQSKFQKANTRKES